MTNEKWIVVNKWALAANVIALIAAIVCIVLDCYGVIHIKNPEVAGTGTMFFVMGILYAHMNIKDLKEKIKSKS